jgi:predicted P-loop ATPase
MLVGFRDDHKHAVDVPFGEHSDDATRRLRQIIVDNHNYDPGEKQVFDAVIELCIENRFDPVADYLDSVQATWDSEPRLDAWLHRYMSTPDTSLNRAIGAIHMIASVRRVRQPGCKYDTILTLEGEQGTNKSSAIEALAGSENFSDETILGVMGREAQERMAGVWLYEIAELTGIHKADVDKVKTFASRTYERARPAFGRVLLNQPRHCTCWATTNDKNYLRDQTGNRRFWPVATGKIDISALRADRNQLWAEAAVREAKGESIVLDEKLWSDAGVEQEQRREIHPWEDLLADIPDSVSACHPNGVAYRRTIVHETPDGEQRVTTNDLVTHVLHVPVPQQTPEHGKRLGPIMTRHGWFRAEDGRVYVDGRTQRGFYRPAADTEACVEAYRQAALFPGQEGNGR